MLYYKFKDSNWIKAESKSLASMIYGLTYVGFYNSFMGFKNKETKKLVQMFPKKD